MTHAPLSLEEQGFGVRTARKDGKQVVTMHFVERDGQVVVECEVFPLSGLRVDPLLPGPYRFATAAEAAAFVDEAEQALTHLGCKVG